MYLPLPLAVMLFACLVLFFAITVSQQGFLRRAWKREDRWAMLVETYKRLVSELEREQAANDEIIRILKDQQ